MELPQSNTVIPAWKSKLVIPYPNDQMKSQAPMNYGARSSGQEVWNPEGSKQRNFKQAQPFYPLPSVNNYYKVNYNLERTYNQPVAK